MQPKIKNTGNPVRNAIATYTLVFYIGSFLSFLIYYFSRDVLWFQTAYAANIAGILMALLTGVAEKMEEMALRNKEYEKKDTNNVRALLNLIAFLLFSLNILLLKNQWNVTHPNAFSSIWITGNGVACMLISDFRSVTVWLRTKTLENEAKKQNMTEMN